MKSHRFVVCFWSFKETQIGPGTCLFVWKHRGDRLSTCLKECIFEKSTVPRIATAGTDW